MEEVRIERTKIACDHCGHIKQGMILSSIFNGRVESSIQLCLIHAQSFAEDMLSMLKEE